MVKALDGWEYKEVDGTPTRDMISALPQSSRNPFKLAVVSADRGDDIDPNDLVLDEAVSEPLRRQALKTRRRAMAVLPKVFYALGTETPGLEA